MLSFVSKSCPRPSGLPLPLQFWLLFPLNSPGHMSCCFPGRWISPHFPAQFHLCISYLIFAYHQIPSSVSIGNPNLTHHPARRQKSLQRAMQLQGMTGTVKAPSAHDQAPTKQSSMGICTISISPSKARSQISTLSWLRDQPSLNCNWRFNRSAAPYAVRGSSPVNLLCYLVELATGYCWSTVLYFALGLFGATLQSHFMKSFFHRPTWGSLQILHETWLLIAISRGRNDPALVKRSTNVWVEQCADLQFCILQSVPTGHSFCFFINFVVTFYWRTAAML